MENDFLGLVKDAQRIFITSHVSPDPDAICSVLLLLNTLKLNFVAKEFLICLEEKPAKDVSFLAGYDEIKFEPLLPAMESYNPDLFVVLDANKFDRVSRKDGQKIREYVKRQGVKSVIVDHHEPQDKDDVDLYINDSCPATVQNVYEICFNKLGLKKPEGYGDITMLGILDDTGRFLYENSKHQQTFEIVNKLVDDGASIETLWNRLFRYTERQLEVISELFNNLVAGDGYTYSFLDDDFCIQWLESNKSAAKLKGAVDWFKDNFLRNIENNTWGFVVYRDTAEEKKIYSVSFRAIDGTKDVAALARKLEGGGHKAAAGGHTEASNVDEAIEKVKQLIS